MPFNAGDKVVFRGDGEAEVQFGPITSMSDQESYLVKWFDDVKEGRSSIVWSVDLEPVPKFKVGQEVRDYGNLLKVSAGPYSHPEEGTWYALETPEGRHVIRNEDELSPVVE